MSRLLLLVCLILAASLPAQTTRTRLYDDPYLSIRIFPGWTIQPPHIQSKDPGDCCVLTLTRGQYTLAINPVFDHTSGGIGGRVSEILGGEPSVDTVLRDDDLEATISLCTHSWQTRVTQAIGLSNLYIDPARVDRRCGLSPAHPVWFASFFGGVGPESDYSIALTSDAASLAALPAKNSPELSEVLQQTVRMLRTLRLKPPIVIMKIVPATAPPGATVTVYGRGFALPRQHTTMFFHELSSNDPLAIHIAPGGNSLTFVVPSSAITMDDCPSGYSNGCSVPLRPAMYHLAILEEPSFLQTDPVPFTVIPAAATPVTLRLLYPATQVRPGDWVTLRGAGFTAAGNTVHIGSVDVPDLSSPDGLSLRFSVPMAGYDPFHPSRVYVSNAGGASNALDIALR